MVDAGSPAPPRADAGSTAPLEPEAPGDELGEGAPRARARKQPPVPSAVEVEEHEITHYPYRAWCRFCVAASGRRDQHDRSRQSMQDDGVALIAIDYAYFTDGAWEATEMERATPILVAADQKHGMLMAEVVQAKGLNPYAVEVLVRFLTWAGHPVIKLRSDGENPIRALATEVAAKLRLKRR